MATDNQREILEGRLRLAQLKVTAPRVSVLGVLSEPWTSRRLKPYLPPSPPSLPKTSLQAVYGVLAALVAAGLAAPDRAGRLGGPL